MRRSIAAAGSALFFALAPGVVAGVVPFWLTRWRAAPVPGGAVTRVIGVVVLVAAVPILIHAFGRFAIQGAGTPAPVAPTEHLVVTGPYRYVRNPMYVAVVAAIVGQALVLGRLVLLSYAAVVAAAFVAFVLAYEEPTLLRRFGAEYEAYRRGVRGWLPRLRPWNPGKLDP